MNHTLKTIADETGESKDTIRKRYSRAKAKHGELGSIVKGVRTFTDDERAILDLFAGDPRNPAVKPSRAEVIFEDEPFTGHSFQPLTGKLAFNAAGVLGRSNGVAHTVTALDEVSELALRMRQGIQQAVAQAQHEYQLVADSAQGAQDHLRDLELAIAEGRAVTTILEMQKAQAVKSGIEAQSKIENMMQGGNQ
jgi:hypothetical protein